jgi:hypothetical protein
LAREDSSSSDIAVLASTDDEEVDEGMVQCYRCLLGAGSFQKLYSKRQCSVLKFQVLTAVSMMFRVVFWDILPSKMIVDRRYIGAYCLRFIGAYCLHPG